MEKWYNFLLKIKPSGKAFRSIFYSKIFYEVLAGGLKTVIDYAISNINDQVWYVNNNFNPEPWEQRYEIEVSEFSSLEERREIVKSYMLFPQYSNRLSLDYFQISLNNAGYSSVALSYNTGTAIDTAIRMNTVILAQGTQSISILNGGYVDDVYFFMYNAIDSNGFEVFPTYISKTLDSITLDMPQEAIVTILTLKDPVSDAIRMNTATLSSGSSQSISILDGGYIDDDYFFMYQAYDSNGYHVSPTYISKTATEVTFDMPQEATVSIVTLKDAISDIIRMNTAVLSSGNQSIPILDGGYVDDDYFFLYQAYDNNGYEVFPTYVSKTANEITLDMPQEATVTIFTLTQTIGAIEDSFLHANDFADERAEFNLGTLTYNSFIANGEIPANLYKNALYLLMSLKPPQVALYDNIDVLQAVALDDNLAIALDDNLSIAITVL